MIIQVFKPGEKVIVNKVSSSQQFTDKKDGVIIRYAHAGFYWVSVEGKELSLRGKWLSHDSKPAPQV